MGHFWVVTACNHIIKLVGYMVFSRFSAYMVLFWRPKPYTIYPERSVETSRNLFSSYNHRTWENYLTLPEDIAFLLLGDIKMVFWLILLLKMRLTIRY